MQNLIPRFQMQIGGESVESESGEWLDSLNPYTGKVSVIRHVVEIPIRYPYQRVSW